MNLSLHTRREFLRTTLMGGALTWTVPAFIQATMRSLYADQIGAATQRTTGKDGPILVVLQLAGGNDGLNTVIPTSNDFYYKARPTLAVAREAALRLTDDFGLHPALAGLKQLFDDGHLAVVHGVGYPNPNRSHFRSTEIWQTASDADRTERYGWIGRYFDNQCAGMDTTAGISVGDQEPEAFVSKLPRSVSFQDPQSYRILGDPASHSAEDEFFRQMNGRDETGSEGASIASLAGAARRPSVDTPIDFLERTALDAQLSSERILAITRKARSAGAYQGGRLARQLQLVAQLIAGGMPTRVYYTSQGGFDTHVNQAGNHERLLKELGDALQAFIGDLAEQGNLDRVAVMTFSEFGRRVGENASRGTDHGAAAPLFIAGGKVRAGVHGKAPDLNPKNLDHGDLRHTVDFRSVYATLLERHLRAPSAPILGRAFTVLNLLD
jgi:uncharacterized protein (DUF1501 family)